MSSKGPELVEEAPRESLDPPPETIRCNRHNEDHDSRVSSDVCPRQCEELTTHVPSSNLSVDGELIEAVQVSCSYHWPHL